MSGATRIRARFAAALVALSVAMPTLSAAQQLSEPASVDLGFLTVLDQDTPWLDAQLAERGLRGRYEIADGMLVTDDLDTLKYVSRIRAFANLDRPRIFSWYSLDLVDPAGNETRCVTLHPRDFLPELGVLDFQRDQFEVPDTGSDAFAECRVSGSGQGEYAELDRAQFRNRYFGEFGELNMSNYRALSTDPAFIAKAIDLGFHATRGSLTGYLQISLDEAG
jgi:hypothetical protein